ncbi:MAG: T9SS type A sorting domain-containing protein [Ignavibacteriaceae bacterium]|nr:T9SS type A sorting domain-containing protein [Ignavibacteriaceae bacterium]
MNSKLTHTIIFLIFLFVSSQLLAQNTWEPLNSPTDQLLRNLYALDENYVWAAGGNGTIVKTTNGGDDWAILNTGVTTFIYDVFFLNENIGWALSFPFTPPFIQKILKTTDGGNSWNIQNYPEEFTLFRTVYFLDSLKGFMGGNYIASTSDGGVNWIRANVDSSLLSDYPVIKFKFFDDQIGFACGGARDRAGVMWRTTDGGLNWSAQGVSPDEVYDFHIQDSLNIIALSGDPEWIYPVGIILSSNAGLEWTFTNTEHFALSFALDFRTENEGWSASGTFFLYTSDSGESWEKINTPDSAEIYDLQFVDEYTGFGSGASGALIRIKFDKPINPSLDTTMFFLNQNYPNPFSEKAVITFFLLEDSNVKLEIHDILGRKVKSLIDERKSKGPHSIDLNLNNFSSGVYFYTLTANNFRQTKKMIYLR